MEVEAKLVGEVEKLHMEPGDIFIVYLPYNDIEPSTLEAIAAGFRKMFAKSGLTNQVALLSSDVQVGVLTAEQAKAKGIVPKT